MDIVIVGTGNVAHCFGHLLKLHGHQVIQVVSRDKAHAQELGEMLNSPYTDDLLDINMEGDIYLLAVSDTAIPELNDQLRLGKRIVVHTAGAVPIEAIARISVNTGVLYPLQSIRKEIKTYPPIPVMMEASNDEVLRRLQSLAQSIASRVEVTNSPQRLRYHLTAVLCNNFTNHLIAQAKAYCEKEQLDFTLLQPIIKETFDRLEKYPPEMVQTGPALRMDEATMSLHRSLLAGDEYLQLVYQVMSDSIYQFHKK
ncbi:putative short-subunit dehydrogenase-like oxidoreductase (DUF2520 family) [Chitinophaga niastensis]|uniref:Putative short-subunit dehydrogenase-like oxidoreductase (DUF2520 family) n=1 Tax=Chitinophaga niastensis TaxID=536980 RepID=A0A2P8HKS2_CHINA|nr:Rossmann-like and DUF2520 domain-containing protein [Chitinophaga niastensis]PSL46815.1 putative short-subunit dehydrogenase-like oxidoreductase (DUF2520 family) [Chitinophaga niastensis]